MGSVGKSMLARGIVPLVNKMINKGATQATPTSSSSGTYVGDNPNEDQPSKTSTQMKKKKATGSTGSGVNIV